MVLIFAATFVVLGALVLFFNSESVQLKLVNSLTQRINANYDTQIEIAAATIDLQGTLELQDLLIRDHHDDTLIFANQLRLKLSELEGVLKAHYQFSSLQIEAPLIKIKTYASENHSNLSQFISKLRQTEGNQTPFEASVEELFIVNGRLAYIQNKTKTFESLREIDIVFNDFFVSQDVFTSDIAQMGFRAESDLVVEDLSGHLIFSSQNMNFEDFNLKSNKGYLSGTLNLNYPSLSMEDIRNKTNLSLTAFQGTIPLEALSFSPSVSDPQAHFELSGSAQGKLTDFWSDVTLSFSNQSMVKTRLNVKYDKQEGVQILSKAIEATMKKVDFEQLLPTVFDASPRLKALNWDRFALSGQVDYSLGKSLEGQVQMQIEEGTIATTFDFKKATNDWNFSQKFSYTNFPLGRLSSIEALKQLDGTAEIAGSLINKNIHQLDWNINVDRLEWEHLLFKNFAVVGTVDQKGHVISGIVNDEKISAAFEVTQLKNKTKDFALISQLSNINLSALGWTPVDSDVRLKALVSLNGSDYNVSKIGFSGMSIMNNKGTTAFNDFLVVLSSNSGINQIKQIGSDFFDLSLRGRFSYRNMLAIAQSAFEEALLIPRQAPVRKQESFEFNLILQERLLKALYPDLISPENINLGGKISSLSGESSFSVFLPFLTYKGYRFEALSLETTTNNPEVLSRFKADKIYWDKGQLSEIALVTKNQKGNLNAQLNGKFGKSGQNSFGLDFSYKQAATKSIFSVARTTLLLGGEQWVLKEGNLPSLVYDTANQQLSLLDFSVKTNQQSLSTDFQYTSINDFSLKVKTENLKLNPILPEGDKFNFWGALDSEVTIVQNDQQTSASIAIALDDLEINKVYLGDLSFNVEGNPQFKTYTVSTQLEKDNSITLKGSGNIYIPNQLPNLNIDLELQDFDISFLSSLGKTKITNSTGNLTGDLNLWGDFKDLKLAGNTVLNEGGFFIPSINARYELTESTNVIFRDRTIDFINANVQESSSLTQGILNGNLSHFNFSAWEMDMELNTERLLVYNRSEQPEYLFHGQGFLKGKANFTGPTKALTLKVIGSSSEGTTLVIPWRDSKGLTDTSFIDFLSKGKDKQSKITTEISEFDKAFRGFEMIFELDINRNAEVEIVVDQSSGSTLSGRGAGNILIESNTDGKFNIWGDFITYDGIYNFKNTGLLDKKFKVNQGGTIVWEGDPLEAQLNIEATYQVPGGANPALLVDNPNFNRKIPTNVKIQLMGNLIKPDDPIFDISFPNTTGIVASEINYRLADQERRQLQAISLLSQGIFISEVSVSLQGITNNLYQKASDVFSTLLGANDGKLNVGLNYLQGEENPAIDLRTEDRVGLTLSTQISDRILINGKIGVPIDGLEETVIVGDVQIDFILNENGNLKAKVFNRENEFRYLGDEFGYTQGMGMSYQVDFNTFQELIKKIQKRASPQVELPDNKSISGMIEYIDKGN